MRNSFQRHWFSPVLSMICSLTVMAVAARSAGAADEDAPTWTPSSVPTNDDRLHDLELTLRIRKAFLTEELLVTQMPGVTVRNRVATLWGSVELPQHERRAVECAARVLGVVDVQSELHVLTEERQATKRIESLVISPPLPRTQSSAAEKQPAPGALFSRPASKPVPAESTPAWRAAQSSRADTPLQWIPAEPRH